MIKKPLVLTNGEIEQLQAGDMMASAELFSRVNNNVAAIVKGQPVYADGGGTVDLAQANAAATKSVLGLVADTTIAANASGSIQTDGVLVATTAEWDVVTGGSGGLTPGSFYYLSADTAGELLTTVPTDAGEFVARVGQALSATELEISIMSTIKL